MKTLALSELRRVAERSRLVSRKTANGKWEQVQERIPWKVWYVAASNGDFISGEECVTLAVYPDRPTTSSCASDSQPSTFNIQHKHPLCDHITTRNIL